MAPQETSAADGQLGTRRDHTCYRHASRNGRDDTYTSTKVHCAHIAVSAHPIHPPVGGSSPPPEHYHTCGELDRNHSKRSALHQAFFTRPPRPTGQTRHNHTGPTAVSVSGVVVCGVCGVCSGVPVALSVAARAPSSELVLKVVSNRVTARYRASCSPGKHICAHKKCKLRRDTYT